MKPKLEEPSEHVQPERKVRPIAKSQANTTKIMQKVLRACKHTKQQQKVYEVKQGRPKNMPRVWVRRFASHAHLWHVGWAALLDFMHFFAFFSVCLQARSTFCMCLVVLA